MMRKLNYFLRLQIKQCKNEIFVNQAKYTKEVLKKFKMESAKLAATLMSA